MASEPSSDKAIRDRFAGEALQAIIIRSAQVVIKEHVSLAYDYADAMLVESMKRTTRP